MVIRQKKTSQEIKIGVNGLIRKENKMTIEEILAILTEDGEKVTIEDYDDFVIIEATNE